MDRLTPPAYGYFSRELYPERIAQLTNYKAEGTRVQLKADALYRWKWVQELPFDDVQGILVDILDHEGNYIEPPTSLQLSWETKDGPTLQAPLNGSEYGTLGHIPLWENNSLSVAISSPTGVFISDIISSLSFERLITRQGAFWIVFQEGEDGISSLGHSGE